MKAFFILLAFLFLASCGERPVKEERLEEKASTASANSPTKQTSSSIFDRKFEPQEVEALAAKPALESLDPAPNAKAFKQYDGIHELVYMQMEYTERVLDFKVRVEVANGNIRVIQAKPRLTGGPLIIEGYLFEHKSGQTIIVEREADREAEEVGGCTGVMVINWQQKRIESC